MKIFVAGATGAIGRRLVPILPDNGYEVAAMTRSPEKAAKLRLSGAEPVVADGLYSAGVLEAVLRTKPDVVIHEMTGLTGMKNFKKFDEEFALTNRLRTAGIDYLPQAALAAGVWSFVHIDDAAAATMAAIKRGRPGVYNIADDEPAPAAVWLPELARAIGAKPPQHIPLWLGRLIAGEAGVSMFTRIRGASNAKAKRELGWQPNYASWREGFLQGLAEGHVRTAA